MHSNPSTAPEPRLMTLAEAGRRLALAPATLRRLTRLGKIPSVVINGLRRISSADVGAIERNGLGQPRKARGITRPDSTRRRQAARPRVADHRQQAPERKGA